MGTGCGRQVRSAENKLITRVWLWLGCQARRAGLGEGEGRLRGLWKEKQPVLSAAWKKNTPCPSDPVPHGGFGASGPRPGRRPHPRRCHTQTQAASSVPLSVPRASTGRRPRGMGSLVAKPPENRDSPRDAWEAGRCVACEGRSPAGSCPAGSWETGRDVFQAGVGSQPSPCKNIHGVGRR